MDIRRFLCVGLAVFGVAGLLGCVHDYACADSCESGGYWFEKACKEYDKDNLELAGDFFHEALQAYEACRDSGREQALCSRNIAVVLLRLAEKKEREEQKESGWLSDLSGLGVFSLKIPRDSAGCYEKAIEMSEKALALYQGVADVEDEKITCFLVGGSARLKVGEGLASAGKFDEAKSILERALEGFRRGTSRTWARRDTACPRTQSIPKRPGSSSSSL